MSHKERPKTPQRRIEIVRRLGKRGDHLAGSKDDIVRCLVQLGIDQLSECVLQSFEAIPVREAHLRRIKEGRGHIPLDAGRALGKCFQIIQIRLAHVGLLLVFCLGTEMIIRAPCLCEGPLLGMRLDHVQTNQSRHIGEHALHLGSISEFRAEQRLAH
ncbi:unnamed protein product, partial [Mycena citricolor]